MDESGPGQDPPWARRRECRTTGIVLNRTIGYSRTALRTDSRGMPCRAAEARRHAGLRRPIGVMALALIWVAWQGLLPDATADFQDSFETAQSAWQLADSDCGARIVAQQRTFEFAHSGNASEFMALAANRGTFAHLFYPLESARVIAEWQARLWVYSNRPGFQLMARVVLPRSVDPRSGQPLSVLLRGDIYDQPNTWQQLSLSGIDVLLDRQVRVLRSQFGPDVDPREAYVDLIVLNAYGGVGNSHIWIDDLEVVGNVPAQRVAAGATPGGSAPGEAAAAEEGFDGPVPEVEPAKMDGSVLVAAARPLFVRAIEHRGESFAFLKSLGFNTVKLDAAATKLQLRQAARQGLWLIAPPPPDGFITPDHNSVLSWYLGSDLGEERLELTRQAVAAIRRADLHADRPLMCEPSERIASYSRLANLMLVRYMPIGSDMTIKQFGSKLQDWPVLARAGTPIFATIQTEPMAELMDQWAAIGLGPPATLGIEPDQIRLLTYQALASGVRGLVFESRNPLDQQDADTQARSAALRRINLELDIVEPWAAGGRRMEDVVTDRTDVRIGVLQTERAQLLLVMNQADKQQHTLGPADTRPLSFVIPFTPVAPEVFELTAGGLHRLEYRRVAGGLRITLDQPATVSMIAVTQEPVVISHLARTLSSHAAEITKASYNQAVRELQMAEDLHVQLAGQSAEPTPVESWLQQARASLRHCELLLGASDMDGAYQFAERCLQDVYRVRQDHWRYVTQAFPEPIASPYCVSFGTLLLHAEMSRRLQADNNWSDNVLPAGDFEDIGHLQATGWENISRSSSEVVAAAELSRVSVQNGQSALSLRAWAADPNDVPSMLESPPLRVVSSPVRVRRGQLIRIHGWLNVPGPIQGSHDGVMIYDSMSGRALADHVQSTVGWEEFVLYRAATYDGNLTVTFDLTGIGQALIDGVTISLHEPIGEASAGVQLEQARRLPPVEDRWQ